MSKLKPIGYDEFARKLKRAGYIQIRKSKHVIYFHPNKNITIPIPHKHPHDMSKGLISRLIKLMGWTNEELNRL